jgi:hypothetical protein
MVAVTRVEAEATKDGEKKPPPKDQSNCKCWSCHAYGHLVSALITRR